MVQTKKKFSVKLKLILTTIPVVIIGFIMLILFAYSASKNMIAEKTQSLLDAEGKASSYEIQSWMQKNLAILDTAVDTMLHMKMSNKEILDYEKQFLESYDDFPNGIYIGAADNSIIDATGWEPDDVAGSTWYQEGISHESFAFGHPYTDSLTGEYIVTASRWIENLNGKGYVAAADVGLTILSEVVNDMEVAGEGDAFIIDAATGTVLAHMDETIVGQTAETCEDSMYQTIYQDILSDNLTEKSYVSEQGTYMVNIQKIAGTEWYLVTRALEKNIYWDLTVLRMTLIIIGIIVVLIIALGMTFLIGKIVKPLHMLSKVIEEVRQGDFSKKIDIAKGNDEVSAMTESVDHLLQTLRDILGAIVEVATEVDERAKNSDEVAGGMYESADNQAQAMGQMQNTLTELADSINVIAENATTLAMFVSETTESSDMAKQHIQVTMDAATEGKKCMDSVNQSMEEVQTAMQLLENSISNVGEAASKIGEITVTISDIAEETNLLALNASIEAARAGEAGRGFSVVAEQIKKLAETSADAAAEIASLITSVTSLIEETVDDSKQNIDKINGSAKLIDVASENFNHIYESIEKTNEVMQNIIEEIHHVNDVSSNMAAITEEQSASAQEIESSAVDIQQLSEQVSENSAQVKEDANMLANAAEALMRHVEKYKIR